MSNPLGITGRESNRFGLNINPKYGQNANIQKANTGDLRDRYNFDTKVKRMGFKNVQEYQQFMWESRMKKEAIQEASNQQAVSDTINGIGSIAKTVVDIISFF